MTNETPALQTWRTGEDRFLHSGEPMIQIVIDPPLLIGLGVLAAGLAPLVWALRRDSKRSRK